MFISRIYTWFLFFFFNDTATTEIYTLSLHDALPISISPGTPWNSPKLPVTPRRGSWLIRAVPIRWIENSWRRSEEHTSELQSRLHLVCRLLLEKKKHFKTTHALTDDDIAAVALATPN